MDVVRLDPVTFLPDALVEGYSSMIWTERFSAAGEFQLKTAKIDETSKLIPDGSLISLRDGVEVMLVESHIVERDEDGTAEMTLTGRTFETFLENRVLLATVYHQPWLTLQAYRESEFIDLLLWNHMVNTTGEDPTRPDHVIDSRTGVVNVVVTDSTSFVTTAKQWSLEEGQLYSKFRDFLGLLELGVRSIRPIKSTGTIVTFDTSRTANRGKISKTATSNITQLRLDVYHGLDRTRYQTIRDPVIFHYSAGHIDTPEYLISIKDLKNMVTVDTSLGSVDVWPDTTPPPDTNVTGLARRTLFLDGGDMGDQTQDGFLASVYQKAHTELVKHRRAVYLDGAVSLLAPYKYNKDYFLGDYVTVMGEFGFEETMMINEFIRTEDTNGDRGYPGLQRPSID